MQSISYPLCPIDGHANEPLSRLCVEDKCPNKSLVCCMCEYERHSNCKTIPIKNFLNQMQGKLNKENICNPLDVESQLNELRMKFFEGLAQCRRAVLQQLQGLQTRGTMFFNQCRDSLFSLANLSQPPKEVNAREFKAYFNHILEHYAPEDKQGFSLQSKYDQLLKNSRESSKKMDEGWNNMIKEVKKVCKSMEGGLKGAVESWVAEMKWSTTLKGAKIKLSGMIAEQSGMESSGERFGLMEDPLPSFGKTRWGIKVKKFAGWVGIGICLVKSIKNAKYHFNYTNIGHGSYLISTNGYSWSHSEKQFNSAFKTFQFTVNDIVYIEYDPEAGKLRFRKNNSTNDKDKFALSVKAPPSGDSYHPCVNLCSTGDTVELVFPGMPLS